MISKNDISDILALVKDKLTRDTESACGLFWADDPPVMRYAVTEPTSEED